MRTFFTGGRARYRSPARGFTLIEACIILIIGGLVVSTWLGVQRQDRARKIVDVNNERIITIKKAMTGYIEKNNRMPCAARRNLPSSSPLYGWALTNCTATAVAPETLRAAGAGGRMVRTGAVPVRDLGLSDAYMTDSWGHLFTYAVSEDLTVAPIDITKAAITITHASPMPPPPATPVPPPPAGTVLYAVISSGKDMKGAFSSEGNEISPCTTATGYDTANCSATGTATFTIAPYSTAQAAQHFDDMVAYSTTVNDPGLPTCGTGETLTSVDGINFSCRSFPPNPPLCAPGVPLTSNDGINFICSPLPPPPAPPPPLPTCGAGQVLNSTDGTNYVCRNVPANPVPIAIPTCGIGQKLVSTDGATVTCKNVVTKSVEVLCKGKLQLTWANGNTTYGCTAKCPAGTTVTGGGSLMGSVFSDNGRNSTQSGNGWACNVAIDSCSGGYADNSGCNMHCSATCAYTN